MAHVTAAHFPFPKTPSHHPKWLPEKLGNWTNCWLRGNGTKFGKHTVVSALLCFRNCVWVCVCVCLLLTPAQTPPLPTFFPHILGQGNISSPWWLTLFVSQCGRKSLVWRKAKVWEKEKLNCPSTFQDATCKFANANSEARSLISWNRSWRGSETKDMLHILGYCVC